MTKSNKSHLRGFSILLKNFFRVHESVVQAMRGKCVRHRIKQKSVVLPPFTTSYYHACEHITRKSRADSCTHCLHARWIMGGAGVGLVCALTEVTISLLQREKVARFTAADEVLPCVYCQKNPISLCSHPYSHPNLNALSRRRRHTRSAYVSIPRRRRLIKIIAHPFAQGAF